FATERLEPRGSVRPPRPTFPVLSFASPLQSSNRFTNRKKGPQQELKPCVLGGSCQIRTADQVNASRPYAKSSRGQSTASSIDPRANLPHHRAPIGVFAPDHLRDLGRAGDL